MGNDLSVKFNHDGCEGMEVSRRSFIKVAVGSLVMVPTISGGAAQLVGEAYADDGTANSKSAAAETTVVVAKANQISVAVFDTTSGKNKRIPNANVKITSLATKKTVNVSTGATGYATLDIDSLAEADGLKAQEKTYAFNGTLEVVAEGYRSSRTGWIRIKGGEALKLATRKLEAGVPYPVSVCFDYWDVLYVKNEFARTKKNNVRHFLRVEFENAGTEPIAVTFAENGGKDIATKTVTPKDGKAMADFIDYYLLLGNKAMLKQGAGYILRYAQGDVTYWVDIALAIIDTPNPIAAPLDISGLCFKPLLFSMMKPSLTFPKSIPLIGESKITFPWPDLNFDIGFDPLGFIRFTYQTDPWGYKKSDSMDEAIKRGDYEQPGSKDGNDIDGSDIYGYFSDDESNSAPIDENPNDVSAENLLGGLDYSDSIIDARSVDSQSLSSQSVDGAALALQGRSSSSRVSVPSSVSVKENKDSCIKRHPYKSFSEQMEKFKNAHRKSFNNMKSAWNGQRGGTRTIDWSKSISVTAQFKLTGVGEWRSFVDKNGPLENNWRIAAHVQPILAFNFTYWSNFFWGPVPILFEFSFMSTLSATFGYSWIAKDLFPLSKWKPDYQTGAISFAFVLSPSISLGLGVKGLASVSIRAIANLSASITIGALPEHPNPDMSNPHMVVGYCLKGQIVICVWLFTWEIDLDFLKLDVPDAYDNWKGGFKASTSDVKTQADEHDLEENKFFKNKSFESMLMEARPITDGELKESVEVKIEGTRYSTTKKFGFPYLQNGVSTQSSDEVVAYETVSEWLTVGSENGIPHRIRVFKTVEKGSLSSMSVSGSGDLAAASVADLKAEGLTTQAKEGVPVLEYSAAGSHGYQEAPKKGAIRSVAREYGLIPDSDVTIAHDVLGEPRVKVVEIWGAQFMFRIGTAQVKGKPRTRVLMTAFDNKNTLGAKRSGFDVDYLYADKLKNFPIDFDYEADIGAYLRPMKGEPPLNFIYYGKGAGTDTPREEYYDYDFDVYVEKMPSYQNRFGMDMDYVRMHFVIVSGTRPNGGKNLTMAEAMTNPVITYLQYDMAIPQKRRADMEYMPRFGRTMTVDDFEWSDGASTGADNEYGCHNFSCPHICMIKDEVPDPRKRYRTYKGKSLFMTFLDRAGHTPKDVLSDEKWRVNVHLGVMFFNVTEDITYKDWKDYEEHRDYLENAMVLVNGDDLAEFDGLGSIEDRSIYQMTCTPRLDKLGGRHMIMFRGNSLSHYLLVETTAAKFIEWEPADPVYYEPAKGIFLPQITSLAFMNPIDGAERLQLVEWPGHEEYLASVGGKLQKARWVNTSGNDPKLEFEEAGPSNFNITTFGLDETGQFLYYPACRVGTPGYSYDDSSERDALVAGKDADELPDTRHEALPKVEEYIVMACKLHGERFSAPFVFAEMSHSMDTLSVVKDKDSAMTFISSNPSAETRGCADLWYTTMPFVRSVTVIGCEPDSEVVFPGSTVPFTVTVRNDGNTYVKGFTAQLCVKDGKPEPQKVTVAFSEETLQESAFNIRGEDGKLKDVEPDFSLAPGKTGSYRVDFTIPASWTGKKTLTVVASNVVSAEAGSGLATQADTDIVEFVGVPAGDKLPVYNMEFPTSDVSGEGLVDAPVHVPDADGQDGLADDGGAGAKGSEKAKTATTGKSATPSTGDPLMDMSGIAAAAALAAGGFAAYSARRARLEREAAESAESDD